MSWSLSGYLLQLVFAYPMFDAIKDCKAQMLERGLTINTSAKTTVVSGSPHTLLGYTLTWRLVFSILAPLLAPTLAHIKPLFEGAQHNVHLGGCLDLFSRPSLGAPTS